MRGRFVKDPAREETPAAPRAAGACADSLAGPVVNLYAEVVESDGQLPSCSSRRTRIARISEATSVTTIRRRWPITKVLTVDTANLPKAKRSLEAVCPHEKTIESSSSDDLTKVEIVSELPQKSCGSRPRGCTSRF